MWALAVFGAIVSRSAISAFVSPSATSRATSNSRAVSGHHGLLGRAPRAARPGELVGA